MIAGIAVLFLIAAVVRSLPRLLSPIGLGVDHYYWIQHVRQLRRSRRFPPVMSQYVLEENQWYPPVFPVTLALLPERFLEVYGHYVAILLDLARMALVVACAGAWSGGSPLAVITAGLLYALTPVLVSFNVQLNPRGLGALLLDLAVLLALQWLTTNSTITAVCLLLVSGCILLTHKMTTQLFWFLCLAGALLHGDLFLLLLIPMSMASALLLSLGRYGHVLKAHVDIVSFWSRNWRWMQAHAIKESPVYGDKGFETPGRLHRSGFQGFVRHWRYMIAYTPHAWLLAVALIITAFTGAGISAPGDATQWTGGIIAFVLLTVFVPALKCLGNGYLYLYNAALPAAILGGLAMSASASEGSVTAWVVAAGIALEIIAIGFFYRGLMANRTQRIDANFERLVADLATREPGTVMCIPGNWYEFVSWKTGFPILWGGHGYGFRRLEPTFPRLLLPIPEVIATYRVKYLVCIAGDLPEKFLHDLPPHQVLGFGAYRLMTFGN